jgi:hypothetical protein
MLSEALRTGGAPGHSYACDDNTIVPRDHREDEIFERTDPGYDYVFEGYGIDVERGDVLETMQQHRFCLQTMEVGRCKIDSDAEWRKRECNLKTLSCWKDFIRNMQCFGGKKAT